MKKKKKLKLEAIIGQWGVWDSKVGLWLGNDEGPITYPPGELSGVACSSNYLARLAATVFNQRMSPGVIRFVAKQYLVKSPGKVDEITFKKSAERALTEILSLAPPKSGVSTK